MFLDETVIMKYFKDLTFFFLKKILFFFTRKNIGGNKTAYRNILSRVREN